MIFKLLADDNGTILKVWDMSILTRGVTPPPAAVEIPESEFRLTQRVDAQLYHYSVGHVVLNPAAVKEDTAHHADRIIRQRNPHADTPLVREISYAVSKLLEVTDLSALPIRTRRRVSKLRETLNDIEDLRIAGDTLRSDIESGAVTDISSVTLPDVRPIVPNPEDIEP